MQEVKTVYDNIPKSVRDDRLYRGLELKNNMKVLLISDASTDKAAAAMDVHVGKWHWSLGASNVNMGIDK